MISDDAELQAYQIFQPHIIEKCRFHWQFLEWEDRVSESSLFFILALRTFPTNNNRFWMEYAPALEQYMKQLQIQYRRQCCWVSLDASRCTSNINRGYYTYLDLLSAPEEDRSCLHVQKFMSTLSNQRRRVLDLLMEGITRRSICKQLNLQAVELRQILWEIGEAYKSFHLSID